MQSDMKKILMMFFALMTGVTAASAQQSSGDFFEGLSRKIGFSRMIAPHGLEITYDKTVHVIFPSPIKYVDLGSTNHIYYVILVVPIVLELEIAQISSIVQILGYINNLVFTITAMKLPKMFPEAWEKSQFHVPTPVFNTLMIITCIAILIQASFMLKSMKMSLIVFNVAVMIFGFVWAFYRTGSGKAKPTVSYEMA